MSLTKLSLGGNNLYMTSLFPPRESLVSDIPAGDGNIEKLFYSITVIRNCWKVVHHELVVYQNYSSILIATKDKQFFNNKKMLSL
jgi:hypothetical protein